MSHAHQMHEQYPRFRIATLLWLMALLASAMGTFGPAGGVAAAVAVIALHAMRSRLTCLGLITLVALIIFMIGLLLPAVQAARHSSRLGRSWSTLHLLSVAIHSYCATHDTFPPAYSTDSDGAPLHSWRTLLLPYLERRDLHQEVSHNEPWDSPSNSKLLSGCEIEWMQSERGAARGALPDETHYFAVVDEEAVFRPGVGTRLADIPDGVSQTIVLIEVAGRGVRWHEPRDLTIDEATELLCNQIPEMHEWVAPGWFLSTRYRGDGLTPRLVAFADGHVEQICGVADRATARALLTRAGGEDIPADYDSGSCDGHGLIIGYVINWPRVISTGLFVALAIGPLFRKRGDGPPTGEA